MKRSVLPSTLTKRLSRASARIHLLPRPQEENCCASSKEVCANFDGGFKSRKRGGMAEEVDLKAQMNQLIRGYWTTQAIFVAAELRIADLLADGPKHPDELGRP